MKIARIVGVMCSSILLVGGVAVLPVAAAPKTVYVSTQHCSDAGPGTQQTPYCTVQKGVDNVPAGGTVRIAAGTYPEQVVIGKNKDDVTLRGAGNATVIQAPATMTSTKTIVEVSKATGVTIRNLEVAGPGSGGCDSLEYGIYVRDNAQVNILQDHVTAIRDNPFSGCQNGVGIQVGRDHLSTGPSDPTDITTGQATISQTKIDDYQKNGITVDGKNSSAVIRQDAITGAGPTDVNGQNGIQISRKATATIQQNTIKDNVYTPQTYVAVGILLYQAGPVTVMQNTSNNNDEGMDVDTHNSTFKQNTTDGNTMNGIYVEPTAKDNTFTQNSAHNTAGSTAFTPYDMEDDSTGSGTLGTANTWHHNSCDTSWPAELCRQ